MDFITKLRENRYDIFNVNEKKEPITKNGFGMKNWQTIPLDTSDYIVGLINQRWETN